MDPITIYLIISAVVAAASTFSSLEAKRATNEYQAKVARNNAIALDQEADLTRRRTEIAMRAKDEDKKRLKRDYTAAAGTNRSLLAAGNVDITSGSSLDLLEGNYNRFADDMGELEYAKELTGWEGAREAQLQEFRSDVEESNASFLSATAGSLGKSILGGALAGGATFAGGKFFMGSGAGAGPPSVGARSTAKPSNLSSLIKV